MLQQAQEGIEVRNLWSGEAKRSHKFVPLASSGQANLFSLAKERSESSWFRGTRGFMPGAYLPSTSRLGSGTQSCLNDMTSLWILRNTRLIGKAG